MGHAIVNKARLLEAGDDFNGMTERGLGFRHECRVFPRPANRAGTGRADSVGVHITQAFAESRQTIERPRAGVGGNIAACRQSFRESHGFSNSIEDSKLPVAQLADNHVKAVGAEIDRSDNCVPGRIRR